MNRAALEGVRDHLRAALDAVEADLAALAANDSGEAAEPVPEAPERPQWLAWGAKVSSVFRDRVRWIAEDLDIGPTPGQPEPSWLMACMAWESGRSFRPDVKNMAGSGATGLIQFMPATAAALGTSVDALAKKSAEDQLNDVWRYFKPYAGRLRSLSDCYMAILWPAGVGQPEDHVLFDRADAAHPARYRQNAGLDTDRDGRVTKREAAAKVAGLLEEGFRQGNVA